MLVDLSADISSKVVKQLPSHQLIISRKDNRLTFKVYNSHNYQQNILTTVIQFNELPKTMQVAFANSKEVLDDMQKTDVKKFTICDHILTFELQIGNRSIPIPFHLRSRQLSYQDEVEYLLWKSQEKRQLENRQKASLTEVNKLKITIQNQSMMIDTLNKQVQIFRKLHQNSRNQHQQLKSKYSQLLQQHESLSEQIAQHSEVMKQQGEKIVQLAFMREMSSIPPVMSKSKMVAEDEPDSKMSPIQQILSSSTVSNPRSNKQKEVQSDECQFYQKFILEASQQKQSEEGSFKVEGNRITFRKDSQQARQFCSTACLVRPRAKLTVQLNRTANHNIWVGVLLSHRIKFDSTKRDKGALSYKLIGNKNLYENGQRSGLFIPLIKEGSTLSLEVDRGNRIVRWLHNEVCIFVRALPHEWEQLDLYPFVTMIDYNDQIQFL